MIFCLLNQTKQQVYHQIITMRPNSSFSSQESPDYKTLYLQCKQSVVIFMKQVDSQISSILTAHQKEKESLQAEIRSLKEQIKIQTHSFLSCGKDDATIRGRSVSSMSAGDKNKSRLCKQFENSLLNCDLSEISSKKPPSVNIFGKIPSFKPEFERENMPQPLAEKKSNVVSGRLAKFQQNLKKKDNKNMKQRQNQDQNDQNEQDEAKQKEKLVKQKLNQSRKEKRLKSSSKQEDVNQIKDILKGIRQNLSKNPKETKLLDEARPSNIISRDLFTH